MFSLERFCAFILSCMKLSPLKFIPAGVFWTFWVFPRSSCIDNSKSRKLHIIGLYIKSLIPFGHLLYSHRTDDRQIIDFFIFAIILGYGFICLHFRIFGMGGIVKMHSGQII